MTQAFHKADAERRNQRENRMQEAGAGRNRQKRPSREQIPFAQGDGGCLRNCTGDGFRKAEARRPGRRSADGRTVRTGSERARGGMRRAGREDVPVFRGHVPRERNKLPCLHEKAGKGIHGRRSRKVPGGKEKAVHRRGRDSLSERVGNVPGARSLATDVQLSKEKGRSVKAGSCAGRREWKNIKTAGAG